MKKIVDVISMNDSLEYIGGCSELDIENAEKLLNVKFPDTYKEILRKFGVITFGSHEWFGLNISGYLNVIESTLAERKINDLFPSDCFVLENLGIDGLMILIDSYEIVYEWNGSQKKKINDSLLKYYLSL